MPFFLMFMLLEYRPICYSDTGLISLQELSHPCQLCECTPCHTLAPQHFLGGPGLLYLSPDECTELVLITLRAEYTDRSVTSADDFLPEATVAALVSRTEINSILLS